MIGLASGVSNEGVENVSVDGSRAVSAFRCAFISFATGLTESLRGDVEGIVAPGNVEVGVSSSGVEDISTGVSAAAVPVSEPDGAS